MNIELPDVNNTISEIIEIESSFEGKTKTIKEWVEDHRQAIKKNKQLIKDKSEESDIEILISILGNLLLRAMWGEKGTKINNELRKSIIIKDDLTYENYKESLIKAQYRWGADKGANVISGVVEIFNDKYKWDFEKYFNQAEKYHETNFQKDPLLEIKNISFKVRDLALSSFNKNYVANDLHVVRVITRIGFLNYGFDLLNDRNLEMGNNPANGKNYLFLHKLVLKISKLTNNEYSPADLDRIFWSFGRTICGAKTKCDKCPITISCLTGHSRKSSQ